MSSYNVSQFTIFRDSLRVLITLPMGGLLPKLKLPTVDLTGKVAIVTGGNSGIGFAIAVELARQGSTLYLACRTISKADEAVSQIESQVPASKGRVKSLKLDTSSLDSVRAFASNWETLNSKIDFLFHNAGIGAHPPDQAMSPDGFPLTYATNFLGSFLLTYLLEPHLSSTARIIMTSSGGQYKAVLSTNFSLRSIKDAIEPGFHVAKGSTDLEKAASTSNAYMQTKAMQVAFAKLLQNHFDRKAAEAGATKDRRIAHAYGPGLITTSIFDKFTRASFLADPLYAILYSIIDMLGLDASQGAVTGVWLATTKDEAVVGPGMGGGYWDRMSRWSSSIDAFSKEDLERFWVRWEADAGVQWR